jgi:hypothetical protein
VFSEDFEDPLAIDAWAISVQPQNRTCGVWAHSTSLSQRPSTGSGGYALSDYTTACPNPRITTILESPAVNLNLTGLQSVTLEYDIYYNISNGGDTATVEVWDGATWQVVWASSGANLNDHQTFDVTAFAAGVTDFKVRFNYDDADRWYAVDNVTVTVDVVNVCATRVGPPPVPDGAGATGALHGDRLTPAGDSIAVTWDAASCTATEYNLLFGDLSNVSSHTLAGSECSIGTSGSHTWTAVPGGDLFFLVVGTDGSGTEGSWGDQSLLGERNGLTPSGECGTVAKEISGACP